MKVIGIRMYHIVVVATIVSVVLAGGVSADDYSAPFFYLAGVYSQSKPSYPPASNEEIGWLLKQITDGNKVVRAIAAGALGQTGDKRAIEPLLKALTDKVGFVRMNAAMAFVHLRDPRAIKPLAALVANPAADYGGYAATYGLAAQGDDGILALIPAARAMRAAGRIDSADDQVVRAVEVVMRSEAYAWAASKLKSTNPDLRAAAMNVLSRGWYMDEERAQVVAALKDVDDPATKARFGLSVQSAALPKLSAEEIAALVQEMEHAAASAGRGRDSWQAMLDAGSKLASAGNAEAIDALVKIACSGKNDISRAAMHAMARSGNPSAVEAVVNLSKSSSQSVRREAASALASAASPSLIPYYVSLLASPDEQIVDEAMMALGSAHDRQAVKHLVPMLANAQYRSTALTALRWIKDPSALDAIAPLLKTATEQEEQDHLVEVLVSFGPAAVGPTALMLRDPDPAVKIAAATVLQRATDTAAVKPLIAALSDADASVRATVAAAIAVQSDPGVKPALIVALRDSDARVRAAAARGLTRWADRSVYEAMVPLANDKDRDVRTCVMIVRGQMGDASVADELLKILAPNPDYAQQSESGLYIAAIRSAGALKDKRAVTPILNSLSSAPWMSMAGRRSDEELTQSRRAKLAALRSILGRDFGEAHYRWVAYWNAQGHSVNPFGQFLPGDGAPDNEPGKRAERDGR